jgi:hypothetical protein
VATVCCYARIDEAQQCTLIHHTVLEYLVYVLCSVTHCTSKTSESERIFCEFLLGPVANHRSTMLFNRLLCWLVRTVCWPITSARTSYHEDRRVHTEAAIHVEVQYWYLLLEYSTLLSSLSLSILLLVVVLSLSTSER